jgi:hypothetical protein
VFHTDPTRPDTDGDGVSDGAEVRAGTDPLNKDDVFTFVKVEVASGFAHLEGAAKSNKTYQVSKSFDLRHGRTRRTAWPPTSKACELRSRTARWNMLIQRVPPVVLARRSIACSWWNEAGKAAVVVLA